MSDNVNQDRRSFLITAGITFAAAQLDIFDFGGAQSGKAQAAELPPIQPGTNLSFSSMKQIDAGLLNVGYAEAGPADGPAVLLPHGWPYDIHSFVDVAPLLASDGYHVIVPYLRGYGTTSFLSSETMRNGQPAITMEGESNGAIHALGPAYRNRFSGKYEYRLITGGVGHNLPQEAPQAFAQAVVDVDRF